MALRRGKPDGSDGEKWLEVDASMTGTLTFKDAVNLQINGRFEGTLETKGTLVVGEQARVKATIHGEAVTVSGTVEGDIAASTRLELTSTARVAGKISSPRVIMADGAIFQGTLDMSGRGVGQWMTTEELARYLEVDADTVMQWAKGGRLPAQQADGQWRFERARVEEWLAHEKVK